MTIARNSIVRGPGSVSLGAQQFLDKSGISAEIAIETFDIPVQGIGSIDQRIKDAMGKISFTPAGNITAGILTALYPHQNPTIGSSLFGDTDVAAVVHSMAGTKVTFASAALTRMPSLKLSAINTAFGAAEITAVVANNTARSTANSLYTIASEAWAGAITRADWKTAPYVGAWGTAITGIIGADGWDVDIEMGVSPVAVDGEGTIDMTLTGVTVRAKCRPVGLAETLLDSMALQGAAGALVGSTLRLGNDLTIAATGGLTVILKDAALVRGPLAWGDGQLRVNEIGFIANRNFTDGVADTLFSVALTA